MLTFDSYLAILGRELELGELEACFCFEISFYATLNRDHELAKRWSVWICSRWKEHLGLDKPTQRGKNHASNEVCVTLHIVLSSSYGTCLSE